MVETGNVYSWVDLIFTIFNGVVMAVASLAIGGLHFAMGRSGPAYKRVPRMAKAFTYMTFAFSFLVAYHEVLPPMSERALLRANFAGLLLVEFSYYSRDIIIFIQSRLLKRETVRNEK